MNRVWREDGRLPPALAQASRGAGLGRRPERGTPGGRVMRRLVFAGLCAWISSSKMAQDYGSWRLGVPRWWLPAAAAHGDGVGQAVVVHDQGVGDGDIGGALLEAGAGVAASLRSEFTKSSASVTAALG